MNYTLAAVEPHRDSTGLSLGVRLACSSGQDTLGLQIRFWCLVCISSPAQPSADVKHSPFLNLGKANGPSSIRGRDSRRVGRPAAAGNGPGWISSVRTGQERARNELADPLLEHVWGPGTLGLPGPPCCRSGNHFVRHLEVFSFGRIQRAWLACARRCVPPSRAWLDGDRCSSRTLEAPRAETKPVAQPPHSAHTITVPGSQAVHRGRGRSAPRTVAVP